MKKWKPFRAIFFFLSSRKKALGPFSLSFRPSGGNEVLRRSLEDLVIIFFPGTDYSLVRQEILYGKVCLQIRLLFSLHSAHCSIDSGVGGPDFHQVSAKLIVSRSGICKWLTRPWQLTLMWWPALILHYQSHSNASWRLCKTHIGTLRNLPESYYILNRICRTFENAISQIHSGYSICIEYIKNSTL